MILCRVFLGRPYMVKRDEIKLYKNSTKSPFKENIQYHSLYLRTKKEIATGVYLKGKTLKKKKKHFFGTVATSFPKAPSG